MSQYSRPSGFKQFASINKNGDKLAAFPHRNIKVNQASGRSTYNKNIFFGFEKGYGYECITQPYGGDSVSVKGVLLYNQTSNNEKSGVTAVAGALSATYHLIPIFASESAMNTYFNAGLYIGGLNYKFTVPFFGGHDGYKKSETNATLLTTLSAEFGSAIGLLKNADLYEFNMLLVPGTVANIPAQSYIIEKGIDCCEERGDAFYIADLFAVTADNPASPDAESVNSYDTNYAGTY